MGFLIFARAGAEHAQVGLPQFAARLCAVVGIQPCAGEKIPQVIGQRHAVEVEPLVRQAAQRIAHARAQGLVGMLGGMQHGGEEACLALGLAKAHGGQLRLGHFKEGAAQNAQKRHVVHGVVQQGQILNHLLDFLRGERVGAALAVDGHALAAEHQLHLVGHVFADGQQDGDIAVIGLARLYCALDILRNPLRLGHDLILRAALVAVEDMQFSLRVVLGRRAGVELRVGVVVDFRHAAVHDMLKDAVDGVQHGAAGTEIAIENDFAALGVLVRAEGIQLGQKQPRLGQPEAVDGLLDIAHVEGVLLAALAGSALETVEDGLLQFAHVLILIHKDGVKLVLQLF